MEKNLERARDLLPAIVITVLSMIQALALELFWSRFQESDYLWLGGTEAVIGWLQFALLLAGIIQIWLVYVSLMLRFTWVPSMADTTIPFAIGLLEFALIDLTGPATIAPWFIGLSLLFALGLASTRMALRKARRDSGNRWFFDHLAPANWRDYLWEAGIVSSLLLLGIAMWLGWGGYWLQLGSLLFGCCALAHQLYMTHHYWLPHLGGTPPGGR